MVHKKKLEQPLWMALSEDDETIDPFAALDFFSKQKNPNNHLLLYTQHKEKFTSQNITTQDPRVPEENIVSLSHVGMAIAPDNKHYGVHGDFTSHLPHKTFLGAINPATEAKRDLLARYFPYTHDLSRLYYNPHFSALTHSLRRFIKTAF